MSPLTNVDTPDYQRGIVNPQSLLATCPAHTQSVTVTVPPNAENIVVTAWGGLTDYDISCAGVTSHFAYAGQILGPTAFINASPTYIFDVSNAFDEQVTITFRTAPIVEWAVYSDAGVHTVVDLNKFVDGQGNQYVISTIPGSGNGNHPTNELSIASVGNVANGTVIVPAPGAGNRIRVFDIYLNVTSAASGANLHDTVSGALLLNVSTPNTPANGHVSCLPQGVPLSNNGAIATTVLAGTVDATVLYHVETL